MQDNELIKMHLRYKFIYSILGMILGLFCILGGLLLFLNGIVGSTNISTNIFGSETSITDAAPGSILFFLGLFLTYHSRYTGMKFESNKDKNGSGKTLYNNILNDTKNKGSRWYLISAIKL